MTWAIPRGDVFLQGLTKGRHAHGIALLHEKEGHGGSERGRVIRLRHRPRAEAHRAAVIHDELAAQVRLVLELLDESAVTARQHLPVDVARIIALDVGAIFGELDREAVVRTAVHAFPEALDDDLRAQLKRANAREGGGVEVGGHNLYVLTTKLNSRPHS